MNIIKEFFSWYRSQVIITPMVVYFAIAFLVFGTTFPVTFFAVYFLGGFGAMVSIPYLVFFAFPVVFFTADKCIEWEFNRK